MINGYPYNSSVFAGTDLTLCVSTDHPKFKIKFFRQGTALVNVGSKTFTGGQSFSIGADGQDWGWKPFVFPIPANWTSGAYIAVFFELDNAGNELNNPDVTTSYGKVSKALFIVKNQNPGQNTCILYKLPLFTWHAYNSIDGTMGNFYSPHIPKITLHRPGGGTGGVPWDSSLPDFDDPKSPRQVFEHWDARFINWLESNGYNVDYCTDLDIHYNENNFLSNYHLILTVGHDEYWSAEMRDHLENFVFNNRNIAFFSGNTCFWQVRVEDNGASLICYKGTSDPVFMSDPKRTTIRWSDPIVNRPENRLTGTSYINAGGWWNAGKPSTGYTIQHEGHWVLAGTGLVNGQQFGNQNGLVGYEADGALITQDNNGIYQPTGIDQTPLNFLVLGFAYLPGWEHESDLGNGLTATMGIYSNNGVVFNAATTDWARVLFSGNPEVIQITKNVLDKLASYSLKIIGPSTTVCGKPVAVQGGKAMFHVDTSSYPAGKKLKINWTVSGATITTNNGQSVEITFPASNSPVHITVSVDDGSNCPGFGTINLYTITPVTYNFLQLICKLITMANSNIILIGSRNRFKHFADPLWDPWRGELSVNLNPKQVKTLKEDVKQLNRIVTLLEKRAANLKSVQTKKQVNR
jgi:N,N-dimethylformamidase beta subunit-like, C-terminal